MYQSTSGLDTADVRAQLNVIYSTISGKCRVTAEEQLPMLGPQK